MGGGGGGQSDESLYDEDEHDEVDELTPQSYQRLVQGREFVYFLALYNPRCRPCRQLKDEFIKAAKRMKDIVPVRRRKKREKRREEKEKRMRGIWT